MNIPLHRCVICSSLPWSQHWISSLVTHVPIHAVTIYLTHGGWMTNRCVSELFIVGSDNGLSPGRRQTIICTNAGMLLIRPLATNFCEILIEIKYIFIQEIAFWNVLWKMATILSRPQCIDTTNEFTSWPKSRYWWLASDITQRYRCSI